MTPAEASVYTGASIKTLARAASRGELTKHIYRGRSIRYRQDELDAWTTPKPVPVEPAAGPACPHCGGQLPPVDGCLAPPIIRPCSDLAS